MARKSLRKPPLKLLVQFNTRRITDYLDGVRDTFDALAAAPATTEDVDRVLAKIREGVIERIEVVNQSVR